MKKLNREKFSDYMHGHPEHFSILLDQIEKECNKRYNANTCIEEYLREFDDPYVIPPFTLQILKKFPENAVKILPRKIALCEECAKVPKFEAIFTHEDKIAREFAAENKYAPRLPEYKILFKDSYWKVRAAAAKNENAANLMAYAQLFTDDDNDVSYWACQNKNAKKNFPSQWTDNCEEFPK